MRCSWRAPTRRASACGSASTKPASPAWRSSSSPPSPGHDDGVPATDRAGFTPPPYPYDRLDALKPLAEALPGGLVDLSIGTPVDPPPAAVVAALAGSGAERGYPPSIGSADYREAASRWFARRFGVAVRAEDIAACVGTKEFVATLPQWLRLRRPDLDTVLYPAISYPTYEMGALLAGCRAVPVGADAAGNLALSSVAAEDAERALCLWVNSPANPTGALDDLPAAAAWGR
ncbi:MAG: aminotransferase class I/II-fold pyridoxal phosphate-dependent enzyme, partial [Acidimicrobiia bacterium]|nr:aminotransferase class I/II-fold pyridoxal phosphate-dependent enzyme [Acidimicrobiia bacterium]